MKRFLLVSICLFGLLCSAEAQDRLFSVTFLQDGRQIPLVAEDNIVHLKKKPFQIQIANVIDEGVLVGATFDQDLYHSAIGEADLEVMWFDNTGMADELFNKEQSVMLSDEAPNYWFYSAKDDHRFDRDPKESNGRYIGTRTISKLALLDPYRMLPLKNVKQNLYMLFYTSTYNTEDDTQAVNDAQGVQIIWEP